MMGTNLTPAQAQAAIDAHLHDEHDHGMGLKSFADLERGGYGMSPLSHCTTQLMTRNDGRSVPRG
jgi:hypothetical protein